MTASSWVGVLVVLLLVSWVFIAWLLVILDETRRKAARAIYPSEGGGRLPGFPNVHLLGHAVTCEDQIFGVYADPQEARLRAGLVQERVSARVYVLSFDLATGFCVDAYDILGEQHAELAAREQ
jgi:hypothetical protein